MIVSCSTSRSAWIAAFALVLVLWPSTGLAQSPPSGLTAAPASGAVTLTWSPPSLDPDETLEGYTLYRSTAWVPNTNPDGISAQAISIADGDATSFEDTGRSNGTTYFYRLTASIREGADAAEETNVSNIAFATPSSRPSITIDDPDVSTPESVQEETVTLRATITDDLPVDQATVHVRAGGASAFTTQPLAGDGSTYSATIPASAVSARGLEVFVTATDTAGVVGRTPADGIHAIPVETGGFSISQGGGSAQSAYRMLSFPLALDAARLSDVLEDDLGSLDPTQWRLFGISPNGLFASDGGYEAISDLSRPIAPGDAFWLVTRTNATITSGAGASVPTDESLTIPLQSGWNLIGMPYAFDLPLSRVAVTNSSASLNDVLAYAGEFVPIEPTDTLEPFRGYLVRLSDGGSGALDLQPAQPVPGATAQQVATLRKTAPSFDWQIGIAARVEQARDTYNAAAVASSARVDWDTLDRFEPPPIGEYVSLSFPHADWGPYRGAYRRDVRPPAPGTQTWTFEVRSNIAGMGTLTFEGLDALPDGFDAWLVDPATKQFTRLTPQTRHRFRAPPEGQARMFDLLVGPTSAVESAVDASANHPDRVVLTPIYPNPAHHSIAIRYGLPTRAPIQLAVYDILGRQVAVLHEGPQAAGYHVVHWDGRRVDGSTVASGTYLIRLQSGDTVRTGRATLVR